MAALNKGNPAPGRRLLERVLVVDPDPRIHALAEEQLGRTVEVCCVSTLMEAVERATSLKPAVLVTEARLPDGDGLSLARRLSREDPKLGVVLLVGAPTARLASQALRAEVDDYVLKHSDSVAQLGRSVRVALRRRRRDAEVERLLVELTELNETFLNNLMSLQSANLALEAKLTPREGDDAPGVRILVVDDEAATVALLTTLLTAEGHEVEGATSGAEARSRLSQRRFELLITDKNLPDVDGLELIRELKQSQPEARALLMTGFATLEAAMSAVNEGAVGFLRKPFDDLSVVSQRVDEIIEALKAERDELRYVRAIRAKNADFINRFRLLKMKMVALSRLEAP